MPTPEELIQAGSVPGAVVPVAELPEPVVTQLTDQEKQQLEAEVLYDWDHLSASKVKSKRNADPEYAQALDRCAAEGYAGTPYKAQFIVTNEVTREGQYQFESKEGDAPAVPEPVIAPAAEVVEPPSAVVETPAPAPAPAAEVVDEEDEEGFTKTATGWQLVIDPKDGSNPEVFKGKTKREINRKVRESKAHATREIRRRNREREVLNDFDVTGLNLDRVAPQPTVSLGADEVYTLTNQLQDPATSRKAFQQLLAAEVSDPNSVLGAKIKRADEIAAFEASKEIAKSWVRVHPEFYNDPTGENIQTIYRFFVKHQLDVTEKNLDTVFGVLRTKGALLEAPVEEPEPVTPAVDAPARPASVVPAAVAPPAATVPSPSATPPATPGRVRPGSVSTGLSPRQASVRPGSSGPTPVGLTVEEYRRMPINDIRSRYKTDLVFKQGVDKFISEGKI